MAINTTTPATRILDPSGALVGSTSVPVQVDNAQQRRLAELALLNSQLQTITELLTSERYGSCRAGFELR